MGSMNRICSLMIFLVISAAVLLTLRGWLITPGFHRPMTAAPRLLRSGSPATMLSHRHFKVKKHDYVGTEADLLRRSDEVWNECVNVVEFVFPPAEAPNHFY
ncbi:hypothetical protein CDL15_Pgr015564 [Punica granatum]|uniref:Uncharacterized protein n=1 Tax=Punica granatum TaxID=22663 RepID=A0A218VZX5_PUNGR|nr:hypothetical protein CDL15_Pgr015564 [Punica granatum]